MRIQHVQQPTNNSCVSACIAMVTGMPIEQVMEEFHDKYCTHEIDVYNYLVQKGFLVRIANSVDLIMENRLYIVHVASVNAPAVLHEIVVDTRNEDLVVYDPNDGKEGKEIYVSHTLKELAQHEHHLKSYGIDFEVFV